MDGELSLGYLDKIDSIDVEKEIEISRFGGRLAIPKSYDGSTNDLVTCLTCGGPTILVAQLSTNYRKNLIRLLYITCCASAFGLQQQLLDSPQRLQSDKCHSSQETWNVLGNSEQENKAVALSMHNDEISMSKCNINESKSWRVFRLLVSTTESEQETSLTSSQTVPSFPVMTEGDDWLSSYLTGASTVPLEQEVPVNNNSIQVHIVSTSTTALEIIPIAFEIVNSKPLNDKLMQRAKVLAAEYEKRQREGIEMATDYADLMGFQSTSENGGPQTKGWDEEIYEPASSKEEKLLRKFEKEVARSPSQVIRYSFNGLPLWVSSAIETVPQCPHCKGQRVFECQLMPNLINCLNSRRNKSDRMCGFINESTWGVVAIFTCVNDCQYQSTELKEDCVFVTPGL